MYALGEGVVAGSAQADIEVATLSRAAIPSDEALIIELMFPIEKPPVPCRDGARSSAPPAFGAEAAGWSLQRLDGEIATQAAHISAATCRWLGLVAEFDRREGWKEKGHYCCSVWLAWRCGLTPRAAQEHVRVARRLEELPAICATFGRGELTYSKVRALTRVACPENEALLLQHARVATAAQLERICRAYRGATLREAKRIRERRHLSYGWDDDGAFTFRGRLSAEEGALLLRALEAGFEAVRAENDAAEEGADETPTNADALVAVAESALAAPDASSSGGDRQQVVVHVDASTLAAEQDVDGPATLDGDHPIAAEAVRRLACDASVVRILERDGEPLSVGRKTRTIPPALRRALNARDRTCRFPGCTNHRFTDAHHLRHWAHGGETSLDNLVRLCRFHHDLCHVGGFGVERKASGELIFRRPNGRVIPQVPPCPQGRARALRAHNRRASLRISSETGASLGRGERFDLDITVEGLCRKAPAGGERAP